MEAPVSNPPAIVREVVNETIVILAVDPVTTVNALMILVPNATFVRRGQEVEITASKEDLARIHELLTQLERAAQDW